MNSNIQQFQDILNDEYEDWKNYRYAVPFEESEYYQIQIQRIAEESGDEYPISGVYFSWLLDLSIFHLQYANYALFDLKNESLAKEHVSLSSEYGYYCLHYGNKSCGCFKDKNPFIIINKATFMMSNTLLSNEIDKFNTLGKDIIDSLNGDGCIVKKGYAKSTISWFIIKLYSLYSDTEITLHKLLQPKESYPYDNVLRKWDTPDVNEVSKYIEILCDAHLVQAKLDYEIYEREEEEGEVYHLKYKELFSLSSYLYPFEILVWLKLREQAGLENPTEFTHPLMNTPIAKMFLELKEPLEKPQHLPYADELIAKLKEQCPDMDKESVENKSSQQATTQPKLVPKTGHYQATLPKEHPQAEALKADPQAYFTYNEGEHFSLAGLETLDALKRATSKTEDGKHMQLVPTKIHEQFSHTGGASYAKNGV